MTVPTAHQHPCWKPNFRIPGRLASNRGDGVRASASGRPPSLAAMVARVLEQSAWQALEADHADRVDAATAGHRARRQTRHRPPGRGLPLHLLPVQAGAAAPLAPRPRRGPRGRRPARPRVVAVLPRRSTAAAELDAAAYLAARGGDRRLRAAPRVGDPRAAGAARLLRPARVGDGLPPVARRGAARRLAAAARRRAAPTRSSTGCRSGARTSTRSASTRRRPGR